eukprot:TRINITY_DN61733_c0_g1_i1.p1 TRINITY_DN61733_c0_g1~~TRINITY_DN61733_c0_g1_i1.p1  ORF type:complete len:202 (-),score=40.75 TRINITY_DN61733_c0_g1_i1:253-825(-)
MAEEAEAALVECKNNLKVCQAGLEPGALAAAAVVRSSQLTPGDPRAPDWPEGYGNLLRFPFGISDMKALKAVARELWMPDGHAADLGDEDTPLGFALRRGFRCASEMVGVHPVGGPGVRFSAELWESAQRWCLDQASCTGVMLYVGNSTMNCHHWCGRPQFCDGDVADASGLEESEEWNLWSRQSHAEAS